VHMTTKPQSNEPPLIARIHQMVTDPLFVRFHQLVDEPNIFRIVGQKNYERWHSGFWAWLLDVNGSHGLGAYPLELFILHALTHDTVLPDDIEQYRNAFASMPMWVDSVFEDFKIFPNERGDGESSVRINGNRAYFDILLYGHTVYTKDTIKVPLDFAIMVEMKVKADSTDGQATRYADWFESVYKTKQKLMVYVLPSNRIREKVSTTIGDSRWCIVTYQSLHDAVLTNVLNHHKLTNHARWVIKEYIANLRTERKGETMAITNEERELVKQIYAKYESTFIAMQEVLRSEGYEEVADATPLSNGKRSDIEVKVGGVSFVAKTFKTLSKDVITYLYRNNKLNNVLMPWGAGNSRYFIVAIDDERSEPTHVNGKPFVQPEYVLENNARILAIETNISRENGLNMLRKLCAEIDLSWEVVRQ
jgi:hypothetical protein